ncbi:hypothetical protein [Vibrio sp. 10N]|uniref:hypothetical protein n=1 Tax=Vibrio sp. 10N TaxID=3058938 RepID=UPI002812EC59|nr:hypothetical protein VB10N_17110 [Vibrio sp. 10N]
MFLLNGNGSKIVYSLKASVISFGVAGLLAVIIDLVFGLPSDAPMYALTVADILGAVIFSPVIETLLLAAILVFINKFTEHVILSACLCALVFSLLHSMVFPLWGVITFVPFVIFGIAFQIWKLTSTKAGVQVACFIHALNNGYVVLVGMASEIS